MATKLTVTAQCVVGVWLCIRVGGRIFHLHEVWYYITWGRFQNPRHSTCLMLDGLAQKKRYACCYFTELLVFGFVLC